MSTPRTIKGTIRATKEYYARVEKAKKAKERAEKKYNDLWKLSWIDLLVRPIALQLAKHFPGRKMEILGPFGLGCETSVWFKQNKPGVDENKLFDIKGGIKAITFRPGDLKQGELRIVKRDEDNGSCPKGSIGAVNGFNHPTVLITPEMTINDLLKYVH
jgi:hypothetical protein